MNRNKFCFFLSSFPFTFLSVTIVLCRASFQISQLNECPPQDSKFLTLVDRSLEQCVEECSLRGVCEVVGYKRSLRLCELHTSSSSPPVVDNHCVLINRKDMDGPPPKCKCKKQETCDITRNGRCFTEVCMPKPNIKYGKYLGNKNTVGSKKAVMCNNGYFSKYNNTSVRCKKTGIWSKAACTGCPSEGQWFNLAEYLMIQFNKTIMNQSDAAKFCTKHGRRLFALDKLWKWKRLSSVLQQCKGFLGKYWVDGEKRDNSKVWKFSNGTAFPKDDRFWAPWQPNSNYVGDLCVLASWRGYDASICSESNWFICEKRK